MKLTRHLAVGLVILALGAVSAIAGLASSANRVQKAPSVSFVRLDGSAGSIDELKGKVVLVNFWAPSCAVCIQEMPQIVETHRKFSARGYETLAVAMRYDPPAAVIGYAQSRQLPFPVIIDNTGVVAGSFGDVQSTPTSVLINRQGEIVQRFVGRPDFVALQQLVEHLLAAA